MKALLGILIVFFLIFWIYGCTTVHAKCYSQVVNYYNEDGIGQWLITVCPKGAMR